MKYIFTLVAFSLFFSANVCLASSKKNEVKINVKIGWQVPWAIQGHLVQVLKKTDILAKNGIQAEFIGKTAGPELNELAMGDQVDMILTADQPASVLFMKSSNWLGISRLMYNRTSTYVPLNSKINSLTDLKDKQVGVPFGTAAQRVVAEAIQQNQVEGVKFINLGMLEHMPLIERAKTDDEKWGEFDALSGFDPIPAILESKNKVKTIHKGKVCALVVVNKNFIEKNKTFSKKFIKSLSEAYVYYAKNQAQVNAWFAEEAKLTGASDPVFEIAAEYEPNLKPNAKISTKFNDEDFELIQKAADFVGKANNKTITIKNFVTNKYQ